MKVLKIIILTLLITFLLFVASVYITFKYILTPERIKSYVRTYIETTISEQFEKYKKELLDKLCSSGFIISKEQKSEVNKDKKLDDNIESVDVLEKSEDDNLEGAKITKTEILQGINDVNVLTAKVFSDVNTKMEKLKYKVTEYFENKGTKEE